MARNYTDYINDILNAIEEVSEFTADMSMDTLLSTSIIC